MNRDMADDETTRNVENTIQNIENEKEYVIDENQLTSPEKISKIIRKRRHHKAPGDDNTQAIVLKKLPKKMIVQIYYIYNECFKKMHFPNQWKKANIIPIKKAGKDPRKTSSYRPI